MDTRKQVQNIRKNVDSIFLVSKKRLSIPNVTINKKFFNNPKPLKASLKIVLSGVLFFLFFIVPVKIISTGESLKARANDILVNIEAIYPTLQDGNYQEVEQGLKNIEENILAIQRDLNSIGQKNIFASNLPLMNNKITNSQDLVDIAYLGTKIAGRLSGDLSFIGSQSLGEINSSENNADLFSRMNEINKNLKESQKDFDMMKDKINKVETRKLDKSLRTKVEMLKQGVIKIDRYYSSLVYFTESFSSLFGGDYEKKYLVLFQNNTELRATGGFIGTYGIITVKDAKIKDIFVDSVYNPDGQISRTIDPPEPLKKITTNLTMRDANWDPDFPTSARLISDLYEAEGGFTPDGVIAVDTKVFIDLLKITGPIKIDGHDEELNAENFVTLTQYKTSVDYDHSAGNPKKFLADFAPLMIEEIFESENEDKNKIYSSILKSVQEKHISFYSPDSSIQSIYSLLGISGEVRQETESDFFLYVNSNIGGLKTNDKIEESLEHQIEFLENKLVHKLILTRTHNGTFEWPSGINYSYIRFYIPGSAEVVNVKNFEKSESIKKDPHSGMIFLEEKEGFYTGKASVENLDISSDHGKKVVGSWQVLKPGESVTSEIEYTLPRAEKDFSLLIQKQQGVDRQKTKVSVKSGGTIKKEEFDLTGDISIGFQF